MDNSCFSRFHPLAAIATNSQAAKILQPLCTSSLNATLWTAKTVGNINYAKYYDVCLSEHLNSIWNSHKAFVFCLATGAVVRLIAPTVLGVHKVALRFEVHKGCNILAA